jgi:hypothetical protein
MSGSNRYVSGVIRGTGASLDVKTVGFRPTKVNVYNLGTNIGLSWCRALPDASGLKAVAAGTRTFVTSAGITPLANGFNIGTDSTNTAADLLWECWEN